MCRLAQSIKKACRCRFHSIQVGTNAVELSLPVHLPGHQTHSRASRALRFARGATEGSRRLGSVFGPRWVGRQTGVRRRTPATQTLPSTRGPRSTNRRTGGFRPILEHGHATNFGRVPSGSGGRMAGGRGHPKPCLLRKNPGLVPGRSVWPIHEDLTLRLALDYKRGGRLDRVLIELMFAQGWGGHD